MMVGNTSLSSSEQFPCRAEPSKLANAAVSADFVQSLWDSLWESSGGKLCWKIRNCSIKSIFFLSLFLNDVLPPTECRIRVERGNSFLLDVQ